MREGGREGWWEGRQRWQGEGRRNPRNFLYLLLLLRLLLLLLLLLLD